jgi:topoisomerase-4 subunit B
MAKPANSTSLFDDLPAAPKASANKGPAKSRGEESYTAADIEVLEGLEPVRRRPGMYIGGTDEKALHHLFAEVLDNAMDEAVAGHAKFIEVRLEADGALIVRDDGRATNKRFLCFSAPERLIWQSELMTP